MKKKISIKGLAFKNPQIARINVEEPVMLEGALVEKITYEDHCYNKGRQGKFPAYVVFFTNSGIRHIIRETEVSVAIVEVEEVEDDQAIPELPEAQVEAGPSE